MLKTDTIASLLKEGLPKNDPLIVAPQPNLTELAESGAASLDLRLGCWFGVLRNARVCTLDIGPYDTTDLNSESMMKMHYVRFGDKFILHPRSFVLGITMEWIRLPRNKAGYVTSRSSWGRRGLIIATATGVHPGFSGCLTLELANAGEVPIALYPSMAICQFFIHHAETVSDCLDRSVLAGRRMPYLNPISLDETARKIASLQAE
ncbi:MAG: dCTP deaminase [Kiritimatiellae bacterium]|nr:dCTP deaminase [Kiritimatiellia bacterium]